MKQMGIPGKTASLMSEMNDAANDGLLKPLEQRSEKNTTATTIEVWAQEVFLPAYNAKAADATIEYEPRDMDYGQREFGARDRDGNLWSFAALHRAPDKTS